MTSRSEVKSWGMWCRRLESRRTLSRPTAVAAKEATRALVLAAGARVAPMRLAMRVEAAMEIGKGILKGG